MVVVEKILRHLFGAVLHPSRPPPGQGGEKAEWEDWVN